MVIDSEMPITRHQVSAKKAEAIRSAVRCVTTMASENELVRLAGPDDADIFYALLNDPAVYAPIYTLPHPLTPQSIRAFIVRHMQEQTKGEGLLFLNFDASGQLGGYTDVCIWPHWAVGELGGAIRADRQGKGRGTEGAHLSFDWMFKTLGLDLICETASLQNHRTARMLDNLGFERKGQVISHRDDGTTRLSLVWEVTKEEWNLRHGANLMP